MIPYMVLTQAGLIPFRTGPVRFAVGPPDGLTSNAWRLWTTNAGDVYIACRDNFKEAKVSLHASGRWRVGFTTEAITKNPTLVADGQNRAWDVWDRPQDAIPNVVRAFQLIFPTSQLAVRADQRHPKDWANVIHIEAAPPGRLTVMTLFVTSGDLRITHDSAPSFCLASLDLGNGLYAQLVAHGEPEGDMPQLIARSVAEARRQVEATGKPIPQGAYGYFLGHRDDGSRFIFGALCSDTEIQS